MPSNSQKGHYRLRVEGKVGDSGNVFFNESDIGFDSKQASVFIQLSKPIYRQGQNGKHRNNGGLYSQIYYCYWDAGTSDLKKKIMLHAKNYLYHAFI